MPGRAPLCACVCILAALCCVPTHALTSVEPSRWMGDLLPLISNATLLDLTLPGTHDTMTYDLSTFVAGKRRARRGGRKAV